MEYVVMVTKADGTDVEVGRFADKLDAYSLCGKYSFGYVVELKK